jgi:hypothetical protein
MRRIGLLTLCAILLASLCALPQERAIARADAPGVTVDKDNKRIIIDCQIAPRKINDERFKEIYPIEVIACWPFPKGQKSHETVVVFDEKIKPSTIHKALESLGSKAGAPVKGETPKKGTGSLVKVFLEIPVEGGGTRKVPIEKTMTDIKTGKNLAPLKWVFTGSIEKAEDPNVPDKKVYGADTTGTLITIFPVTDECVFQTDLTMKEEKYVKLETDKKLLPKEGTPVKLILEVSP